MAIKEPTYAQLAEIAAEEALLVGNEEVDEMLRKEGFDPTQLRAQALKQFEKACKRF